MKWSAHKPRTKSGKLPGRPPKSVPGEPKVQLIAPVASPSRRMIRRIYPRPLIDPATGLPSPIRPEGPFRPVWSYGENGKRVGTRSPEISDTLLKVYLVTTKREHPEASRQVLVSEILRKHYATKKERTAKRTASLERRIRLHDAGLGISTENAAS